MSLIFKSSEDVGPFEIDSQKILRPVTSCLKCFYVIRVFKIFPLGFCK
jgi:hypothetical protein